MPYNIPEKMKLEATFSKKSRYDQAKKCHLDWNRQNFNKKKLQEKPKIVLLSLNTQNDMLGIMKFRFFKV